MADFHIGQRVIWIKVINYKIYIPVDAVIIDIQGDQAEIELKQYNDNQVLTCWVPLDKLRAKPGRQSRAAQQSSAGPHYNYHPG
jgi:hypothetical protein